MNIGASTIIFVVLIIVSILGGLWYINHCKKNKTLVANRRWIEQIPSIISTLGVLGTFWGITDGLLGFDTNDLNLSIPLLLDGLKTAFFTSLAGMIGSLILSRVVSSSFDKEDGGVSDVNMATSQIVKAVETQAKNQTAFYASVLQTMSAIQGYADSIESSINTLSVHAQSQSSMLTKATSQLTDIHSLTGEIATASEAMSSSNEEVAKGVQQFGEILHGEVLDIEDKMSATNKLLNAKFDEFTELLKKSNTEALVEVMKSVTAEFQKQMNELISKLVQENFEQLNQSVERLNVWQQENKEMISSLTSQYRQMADNFEETSTTLTQVGTDAKMLVSDGGKLQQLITSLNQVIIEDEHFVEITANLSHTAELSKSNMEEFEESTKALNEWVKKQRNFVDGVTMLIEKLDELNKIRDYNEAFWKDTKNKLEEGVGYITEGSKSLNQQLTNLDRQFYARLSATLGELDACISAMVKKHN